jgi:hypothetical protein
MSKITTPRNLRYSAYSAQQSGVTFEHRGTVEGARRKAAAYARAAFPAWGYKGYGPMLVVIDTETGERVLEQRL